MSMLKYPDDTLRGIVQTGDIVRHFMLSKILYIASFCLIIFMLEYIFMSHL